MQQKFNFLPQATSVKQLLDACMAVLPLLQDTEKEALIQHMKTFETFAVPALWSTGDVDPASEYQLTRDEECEALARFIEHYEIKESDWSAMDAHARDVRAERTSHIRVEFDPLYTGGDYNDVGQFVLVPVPLIERFATQDPDGDDGVQLAFTDMTKMDSMHIVNYSWDELYNQHGERIEH